MRTVGEILQKTRLDKKLTLEDVEKRLRIRKKFLQALEENEWNKLPSLPYIKGFLRNYSSYLGLLPEETIAIFRRQFTNQEKTGLLPSGVTKPLNKPMLRISPQMIIITTMTSLLVLFFGYLFSQYQAFISPPNLSVSTPAEGEILSSQEVVIRGTSDPDVTLSINNQKIALSENGEFSISLSLLPGTNKIVVEAISKHGKKKTITRTIQVQEQTPQLPEG